MKNEQGLVLRAISKARGLLVIAMLLQLATFSESSYKAFKRGRGNPQWHHSAFHDVKENVRSHVRAMLHGRAEVPFQVPLEVNIVLVGFNKDGGYRYKLDAAQLEELLRRSFPSHRPSCLDTGEQLDIEHNLIFNVFPIELPELIELEKGMKKAMVPSGNTREAGFGRVVTLYEVEATDVEPVFQALYTFLFDFNDVQHFQGNSRSAPHAIFLVNFDKVRMDPQNKEIDLDKLMFHKVSPFLNEEDLKKQEADYIYRYKYNGGGATQAWLSSDRFVVIDISAGPCTYGRIETEEGTVSYRTIPRLRNVMIPGRLGTLGEHSSTNNFVGQIAALVATTVEFVIAPDVRFETLDMATRLLIPVIVLQNHHRYNILDQGHNYSINLPEIQQEVNKMVHHGEEVLVLGGSYSLHLHEKLAIAVSKAMRGHSVHETKQDGRFHVQTKTFLDGAILREEVERSADVLAAGLVEMASPSLSSTYFLRQEWEAIDDSSDSILMHKPLWSSYESLLRKETRKKKIEQRKKGTLYRTYGTKVVPVFVLSLADVDPRLMMEEENLVWASKDVVIVLQHQSESIPLSYVSETERRHAFPSLSQRHVLAGLASAVGGLTAPYEKASHIHGRPTVNWLWSAGCHPFGPFSNSSHVSKLLLDVALRNRIYALVDAALHRVRDSSETVQTFAAEYLVTPLGESVKGKKNKTRPELWLEKFYMKTTSLPEPFPHELVERLQEYLKQLEDQLVDLSSLLYDHRLEEARLNSSQIFQSAMFTKQYIDHVLARERDTMKCCKIDYKHPLHSSQTYLYGAILLCGFLVYFVVIFFSKPVR